MPPANESLARRETTRSLAIACDGMKRYKTLCILRSLYWSHRALRSHNSKIGCGLVPQCVTISCNSGIGLKRRAAVSAGSLQTLSLPIGLRSFRAVSIRHEHEIAESGLKMSQRLASRDRGSTKSGALSLSMFQAKCAPGTLQAIAYRSNIFSNARALGTVLRSRPKCAPTLSPKAYCFCRMMRISRARVSRLDLQLLHSTLRPA
jgi:hypothetical protein